MFYKKLPIILLLHFSLLSAYHTQIQANDSVDFFQQLKSAQTDIFEWLQDEFHFYLNDKIPARARRDIIAENGDDWYRNFECRVNNKSCTNGMLFNDGQWSVKKISGRLVDGRNEKIESRAWMSRDDDDVEKLHSPKPPHNNGNSRINDKNMEGERLQEQQQQQQHLAYDVSDQHHTNKNSNDNSAINGLLNVRTSIAARQNEIHEIELKHQKHLTSSSSRTSSSTYPDENLLNDNQLDGVEKREEQQQQQHMINGFSSNSNFEAASLDASLGTNGEQSSGTKPIHYDDQLDAKQNNLFDELKDTSNYQQQILEFNGPHRRVKRNDVINQIIYGSESEFDGSDKSIDYDDSDEMSYDNNLLNDDNQKHVNTSAETTEQEMNNVNENFSNDKSDNNETVNNQDETTKMPTSSSNNAKIIKKRDIRDSSTRPQHEHSYSIKGRQKISDLISGELPNQIVKAANKLVNSNDALRRYIKPHLNAPNYSTLKDSTKSSSIKINNMMSELVTYINELVNDQVQMRSCIPLTEELQNFYQELMGRRYEKENVGSYYAGNVDENSIQNFLMTKRKSKRNVNSTHSNKLELTEKCEKVRFFHAKCLQIAECKRVKPSLIIYFKRHEEICEILKKSYNTPPLGKFKRSFEGISVSPQFAKLYNFKNYFLESREDDL